MKCEDCKATIVGQPGRVGSTRAPGNGFYKGSRQTFTCANCVGRQAEFEAGSAYRATIEQGVVYWNALVGMGQNPDQIEAMFLSTNYGGPEVVAAIKREVV